MREYMTGTSKNQNEQNAQASRLASIEMTAHGIYLRMADKEINQETSAELAKICREKLPTHKVPSYFEFRPDLPHSATGKILKRAL